MCEKVVVMQFARANNGLPACNDPELDTTSADSGVEMQTEAEQTMLHLMGKVHDIVEMGQGSQNLAAIQKESRAQKKQMTAIGYISDTKQILKASWSNIRQDGVAAFKFSEKSPVAPAVSAKDLSGGQTQVLNFCRIKPINSHSAEHDEDSSPESITDTKNWLNCIGDLDNPNDSEDNWEADNEPDIQLENCCEDSDMLGAVEYENHTE